MRKTSYVFLTLGLVAPFVTEMFIRREAVDYRAKFGFDPEGMGLVGSIAEGAAFTFVFFLLSAIYATRAYRRVTKPRPLLRKIELTAFWLPFLLTFLSIGLLLLGNFIFTPPQIIQTT